MTGKITRIFYRKAGLLALLLLLQAAVYCQQAEKPLAEPKVIQPASHGKAPSDAIVLFDKGSLDKFESIVEGSTVSDLDGTAAPWKVKGRKFTVIPGTPNIQTKEKFGDCQLHIEWKTPKKDVRAGKKGQECGNSGIYLMGKYELQVLNSYINTTNYDQQAGAVYRQYAPLVNASLKPGKWQVYDIIFTAPRFNADGSKMSAGYFTVFHNGVLIQNHVESKGPSWAGNEKTPVTDPELPLMLQNHQNEVSYRNIWIRRL
ncbi:MAG TPA: DUF1080 domain-containing protein [Prolixibacteraceae bacterium]|nr:DUF1080 domain-containing protein [Prolixibacteraceae bacterium]